MTGAQRAFNKVVRKLRKQNCKSSKPGVRCAYRGANNTRCGIGHLIPNNIYNEEMDSKNFNIVRVLEDYPRVQNHLDKTYGRMEESFWWELQLIHDGFDILEWEDQFHEFADKNGLTVPIA